MMAWSGFAYPMAVSRMYTLACNVFPLTSVDRPSSFRHM